MFVSPAKTAPLSTPPNPLAATGMSLNEYVVNCAVAAASNDLADRQVFAIAPDAWEALQGILDRPAVAKPKIAALLDQPSVLEQE